MTALPVELEQVPALLALLEERHVTRAAHRVGITQSSMSHRLRQLREALGDDLMVRAKGGYVLTPRAQALLPALNDAMQVLRAALHAPGQFDPQKARLFVRVALPDLLAPFLPGLCRALHSRAPLLKLETVAVNADLAQTLEEGSCLLAVAPEQFADDKLVTRGLGQLRFGVVGRKGHPALRTCPSVETWLSYPHVVVSVGHGAANKIEQILGTRRLKRQVGLVVPGFLSGLVAVARSDLLMNAPLPLADEVVRLLGIQTRPVPLTVPKLRLSLMWHERFRNDAAHCWLRARVHEYFAAALKGDR